jgi:arylsulfatase B
MHGSAQIPTPNIDGLAAGGVRLNKYYVNPVCSPTRASLMRSAFFCGAEYLIIVV